MRKQFLFLTVAAVVSAQGFAADWDAAYTKAKTALGKLSQNDRLAIVSGIGWGKGPCAGNTGAATSIGFRSLCLQDGPLGVRGASSVTAFPPGVQAASTWDRALMRDRGKGIGQQSKALGVNVILGPVAGPLGKIPNGGRNWEGFGSDPYLCGVAMEQTVGGIQEGGAQACAKHYIGNEQEKERDTVNSVIDDRTLHELYLWPFAEAVRANVASIMCSYNKVGVKNSQVSQGRLDDMVTRILASWYLTKQDSGYPATAINQNTNNGGPNVQGNGATNAKLVAHAITTRAKKSGTTITTSTSDSTSAGASAAQNAEIAIVFITADSGEGYITVETNAGDRNNLEAWHSGADLVKAVAAINKNTIVVIHSVGPIILESFVDLGNVKAIVWAGLPGQESGNALVEILWGDASPSGKLPYTIAKQQRDYGTNLQSGTDSFSEGLFIDYRYLDKNNIAPRFEFGFGLCPATGNIVPGGISSLFDIVATVTMTLSNSGAVSGAEVAQLYLGFPSSAPSTPVRQLRGFQKTLVAGGASTTVKFELRRKDLSYWDASGKRWVLPAGNFKVEVGASSKDLRLSGSIVVT
ncbi:putative beta-glucosidase L [Glarea lozoyensis 74030]|uniref:beta-glucosidase n=1 Tax=Glarea lozoyensis (strain ATCC 74030 / MF5533) TaxID=1104152 RepID=H0EG24_GLAL7|nr:putative beta-glucosidase L [Glarea lozoyensis 74030]